MIFHIEEIDRIREVEEQTAKKTQAPVFDISNWNSGEKYKNYLYQYFEPPSTKSYFDYIYSYEIDKNIHSEIRRKLHFNSPCNVSILLPSSTLAIVNIANFLQKKGIKKICVLQPSYFSVVPCLQAFGLSVYNEQLTYINGEFTIPLEEITKKNYDAVWITSPVFCTNIVYQNTEINKLNALLREEIYLICDESLSSIYIQLSPYLINNEYLFSIYSPHKVLGTNAMKFSCIIMHQVHQDFFDIWTDLFAGGMSLSSEMAITHFLSDNYEYMLREGMKYIHQNYIAVKTILQKHQKYCSYTHASGVYMTIILKNIPYNISTQHLFIKLLIENTNVSLLPGYLEGFLENFGFCFRINMTLDRTPLLISLEKVLVYLEKTYL